MKSYIHLYKTNQEFTEAFNSPNYEEPWLSLTEENNAINYSKMLTAITFENLTWKTDVPSTGGTATKGNCEYKIMAKYLRSEPEDITSQVADNVTGQLVVAETTATTRQSVGTLTLTAEYKGITCTGSVAAYQEAFDPLMKPLTFKISSDGKIRWTTSDSSASKTIEYNLNDSGWTSITSNTGESAPSITVNTGDIIQFRGSNTAYSDGEYKPYSTFIGSTAEFEIEGNIMSLVNSENFATLTTLQSDYTFKSLFNECTGLTSAENLILPATTLTNGCYYEMFFGCTSLTSAPALPATDLAIGCYSGMFWNCTSLATAPALPATTLHMYCYQYMFYGCKSLTTAPELPATTLANFCYDNMFAGYCNSLTTAPSKLPATTLAQNCYSEMFNGCDSLTTAPELPATTLAYQCCRSMFYNCTSLTTAPFILPATTLDMYCYDSMFGNCRSLTTAPELPATKLKYNCYQNMFYGCTNLNYIKCLAEDISATDSTKNWVRGVASTGKFVKAASMTKWTRGISGIPDGWTRENAS